MSVTILVMAVPPSHNVLRRKYRDYRAYKALRSAWERDLRYSPHRDEAKWLRDQASAGNRLSVRILIQHKRLFDVDNAYASCKPILDAMVELGYLKDDSPDYLDLRVEQEKINAKQTKITISEAE